MDIKQLAQGKYIHWANHSSMYSGKTRAYLIKKGIEYVDLNVSHPHFSEQVVPKIGFMAAPVLETPDGEIIQDSTDIIRFLEQRHPEPSMLPEGKPMQAIAWLLNSYGTDATLPAAMHYRWNFKDANYGYVFDEFRRGILPHAARRDPEAQQQIVGFAGKMDAYLAGLGITPATIPAVESSTEQLFDLLNAHFEDYPYLLGGRPSVADCGMMTALHAHLGRDPYPAQMMKTRAPALYHWTETMNRPGLVHPSFWHVVPEFFTLENLPETLLDVLRLICLDYAPELEATAAAYNGWLQEQGDLPAGTLVAIDGEAVLRQSLGEVSFTLRGVKVQRQVWTDTLITYQPVLDLQDSMSESEFAAYSQLLAEVGGDQLMSVRFERALARADYRTVLR